MDYGDIVELLGSLGAALRNRAAGVPAVYYVFDSMLDGIAAGKKEGKANKCQNFIHGRLAFQEGIFCFKER
jgi:hypothetical protein